MNFILGGIEVKSPDSLKKKNARALRLLQLEKIALNVKHYLHLPNDRVLAQKNFTCVENILPGICARWNPCR